MGWFGLLAMMMGWKSSLFIPSVFPDSKTIEVDGPAEAENVDAGPDSANVSWPT